MHSRGTAHTVPWVVNAVYDDRYPRGRHLGHEDDLLFSVSFTDGGRIHAGPPRDTFDRPVNSGARGGRPEEGPPALYSVWPCPAVAARDPLGVVPPGRKAARPEERVEREDPPAVPPAWLSLP